jgi:hypothetical protein
MLHQVVRLEISESGSVIAREETQPLFELQKNAMAMAEFEAARYYDQYDYDSENDCWIVRDCRNRIFRLVVEAVLDSQIAAWQLWPVVERTFDVSYKRRNDGS